MPDQRPVTATIFGILNLVFGIIGLCGNMFGIVAFILISSNIIDPKMKVEMNLQQVEDPVYFGILSTQLVSSSILSIVIIISGIALLNFKPSGRWLANFYAVGSLILLVLGTAADVYFTVVPALNEADKAGEAIVGAVRVLFALGFGMIFPICILIFLNRKRFVDQILGR